MNTQNRLGIWISKPEHLTKIKDIIPQYPILDDIFLISDEAIYSTEYAVVPSYYIMFNNIIIVFLDLEDFITNKHNLRSSNISLACSSSEIINSGLDKSFFQNIRIIEL